MNLRQKRFREINCSLILALISAYMLSCSPAGQPTSSIVAPADTPTIKAAVKLTTAQIAMLDLTPERQKVLEEGAKAEGELMLYTTSSGLEPVAAVFMRKYPFIKMEVYQSPDPLERIRAEIATNRLGGDIFNAGIRFFIPLSNFFIPFKSPAANFSVHPRGAINHLTLIVFAYNTNQVADAEVPQKLDDLLLPRWKGKIGFHGPPNTFAGMWTGMLLEFLGENQATAFLKALGEQNLFLYQSGGVGIQALTSGETHIGTQSHSSAVAAKLSKAPLNWIALDPTMATVSLSGIFEKSPHPYSAMLYQDFLLGPEGQKALKEAGNYLSIRDVEQGEAFGVKLPKRIRIETPDDEANVKKWNALFSELAARKK